MVGALCDTLSRVPRGVEWYFCFSQGLACKHFISSVSTLGTWLLVVSYARPLFRGQCVNDCKLTAARRDVDSKDASICRVLTDWSGAATMSRPHCRRCFTEQFTSSRLAAAEHNHIISSTCHVQ
jgi:hypothetical protein